MSWNLRKKAQALLAEEQGTFHKEWGGKVAIALVYPNTYAVGMSNLGFQTIYWHLNQLPDVVCERVFLPDLVHFMDFVAVGEGEELVRQLIALYRDTAGDRDAFLERVGAVAGVYVPGQYDIAYHPDGTLSAVLPRAGAPAVVVKRRLPDVNRFETISLVKTPQAEYGHMALLEVGKGCGRGCRFC